SERRQALHYGDTRYGEPKTMNAPLLPACEVTIVEERMARRLALVPLLLALSIGCTQQKGGPMPTHFEDALSQLDKAAASKSNAKQPDAVTQALLPPLVVEMPRAEGKPTEARFDLAVNNAPAAEVFMAITSGSPYSMIVHPSINEKLSVKLKDVTVLEALDTLRDMYGYEY